ncbi:HVA22/TB2/DP1 family protein [Rhodotorula paludigena]|uniref:HVA22/TB2/DP1 family protein n=1 Tax=Rhodotorula paludigena TaxID=86838 RepID=UPI00317F7496
MATAQQKFDYYISQVDKELSKYPSLNHFEAQTGVPKAYATLGAAAVFTTLVFFNIAAGFLTNLLGWGLPAYFSLRALESPGHDDDVQWLTYWIVYGGFTFAETFAKVIVAWFPYYYVAKTLFILYLVLPSTRGAVVVYDKVFKPLFAQRKVAPTSTTTSTTTPAPASQ